jgi:cation diffusion facilitator CzcD-associated flavoprotein CzcO
MIVRSIETNGCDTIVIGAGPYGLAVAAHLKARGVAIRVFGDPMSFWRRNMPQGMKLRSPWGATSIADPADAFSLDAYIKAQGVQRVEPLPLETFVDYGAWFQSQAAPDMDHRMVARIEMAGDRFRVATADGETIAAKRVVVAMGLANQHFRPAVFAGAPAALVTHTFDHAGFDLFHGKRVAVVGRGQSACETAALLSEAGAQPRLICRGPIRWLGTGELSTSWRRRAKARLSPVLAAPSAVGPFPLNWLVEAPSLVHRFPEELRMSVNASSLRAAAAGWLAPRFGGVGVTAGVEIVDWAQRGEQIEVKLDNGAALFDHVVLATGYKIDIAKLGVFAPELLAAIACRDGSPTLSAGLESSVPGLHFAGASAVFSFGPLLRFIAGSHFAAREIARVIAPAGAHSRRTRANRLEYDLAS